MANNTFLTGSVLTIALLGCGGVSGIPIEKTATDFAETICPKAYNCCTADQLMGNKDLAGTTEQECEAKTTDDFRKRLNTMQASENAGRGKYDQVQVDACLEALRAATCSELTMIRSLSGLPACNATFVTPLVAVGGKCEQDFECIGSVCQKAPGAWDGLCVVGLSAGASCATDRCAEAIICDGRGTSDDSSDDVCVAEQDNGATCTDAYDCKSRNCVADANGAKTCTAVTAPQCFYGGGCSSAGGRPGAASLLLMGLFGAVALYRKRRAAGRRLR